MMLLLVLLLGTGAATAPWGKPTEYVAIKRLATEYFEAFGFTNMPLSDLDLIDPALAFARSADSRIETQLIESIGFATRDLEKKIRNSLKQKMKISVRFSSPLASLLAGCRLLSYAATTKYPQDVAGYKYEAFHTLASTNRDTSYNLFGNLFDACKFREGILVDHLVPPECLMRAFQNMEAIYMGNGLEVRDASTTGNDVVHMYWEMASHVGHIYLSQVDDQKGRDAYDAVMATLQLINSGGTLPIASRDEKIRNSLSFSLHLMRVFDINARQTIVTSKNNNAI